MPNVHCQGPACASTTLNEIDARGNLCCWRVWKTRFRLLAGMASVQKSAASKRTKSRKQSTSSMKKKKAEGRTIADGGFVVYIYTRLGNYLKQVLFFQTLLLQLEDHIDCSSPYSYGFLITTITITCSNFKVATLRKILVSSLAQHKQQILHSSIAKESTLLT